MQKRIWELDALRGFAILCMVGVHFAYALPDLFPFVDSDWFYVLKQWGGYVFVVLCGVCATLGSRPVRRGALVFGCGMVCTAVTLGLYLLRFADKSIIIWFGALHCLGACMLLWPLFRKMPWWLLALCGITGMALGWLFDGYVKASFPWLVPLGITFPGFSTVDYFPLFPNFGAFLLGAAVGRLAYRQKQSLLPRVKPPQFLCACGKHSLWIYLLHQPAITLVDMLRSIV